MAGSVSNADVDRIEEFYRARDTAVVLDVCPLADPSLHQLLGERGYRITEFNNVLVRRLEPGISIHPADFVRRTQPADEDAWARTVSRGFFERDEMTLDEQKLTRTIFRLDSGACWLASTDGTPAAAAAMGVEEGVATFFADSTLTAYRRRGLQSALIQARLAYSVEQGCDLVTASTVPGSSSQFNYERLEFRVIYTKYTMSQDEACQRRRAA